MMETFSTQISERTDDLIARIYEQLKNIEAVFHIKVLTEEDHKFFTKTK